MARIEGSKPRQTTTKALEKKDVEATRPETAATAAPAVSQKKPDANGFDVLRKKLVSVSGRYAAHKPQISDRADLKELVSAQRLAQQAGSVLTPFDNPSARLDPPFGNNALTKALENAPAPGEGISNVFQSIEANKLQAGTGGGATKARSAEAIGKELAGKSLADAGDAIAKLSPRELANLEAGVKAGKVSGKEIVGALLNGKAPADQVKLLKDIPKKTLDGLKELVRAGKTDMNKNIAFAVGVEVAAQTEWGKKNPGPVAKLREAHGKFNIEADLAEGLGSARDGKINVKAGLLKSPEALAAVLAHEGTHLHQGSDCCGGQGASSLAGETEGNVAGAKVWEEIGNKKDPAIPDNLEQLNGYAAAFKKDGVAGVKARVGAAYIKNAEEKIAARKAEAKDNPSAAAGRAADDTLAAWEAQAEIFRKDLAKK